MKLKVYKIAAMAVICVTALVAKSYAQQTPAIPPTPPAPAVLSTPLVINVPLANMDMLMDNAGDAMASLSFNQTDTAYKAKMKRLQEQMRDLQKQMSSLRVDEMRKNSAEMGKRYAEQSRIYAESFNKNFTEKFKNFGQSMHFNFDNSDADLDKKVQSGDVKLKSKAYSKSYSVNNSDKLEIDNRFGKVTVNTWNKNEFKVDVEIKAYANDDDDAQKLLDQVKINDSKDNSVVSFTTVIGDENHKNNFWGSWTSNGKTNVRKTIINYIVYIPAKSALTITNRYGGTILPDLYGKLIINNSYGSLSAKSLTNAGNVINVKYGSADIENLVGSDLNVAYGSLNLQSADKLNADVSYGAAKIGKISTSGTINVRYGGLQIDDLDRSLRSLSVNTSYTPVKLGSIGNDNADFDVTTRMGGFSYDSNVNVTSKSPTDEDRGWSSTKNYKGHIGKGSTDKLITIKASYGSVKFDQ